MSATAKMLSSATSSTIGTASSRIARPIGPWVKSWFTSPRTDSLTMVQKLTDSAPPAGAGVGSSRSTGSAIRASKPAAVLARQSCTDSLRNMIYWTPLLTRTSVETTATGGYPCPRISSSSGPDSPIAIGWSASSAAVAWRRCTWCRISSTRGRWRSRSCTPTSLPASGPKRFLREIHLAARLDHPHILPVYDSGEAAGQLWYVMPYVEGESLRERLRREVRLPIRDAVRITREMASALEYAHARDVVHRDIKPENIMLAQGHARLTDFGIAKPVEIGDEALTRVGFVVGTPKYMSPEQASGEAVDPRSDLYSLACVLYEMLAGETPYTGPSAQAIIIRSALGPVPLRAGCPPGRCRKHSRH